MAECDLNHAFVASDHHFRDWTHLGGVLAESTQEEEARHIELWNSVVGKDDLVLYVGDFCDGGGGDLEELGGKLNGRKVLIKGNHDGLNDEWYRFVFEDVLKELRIGALNVRLIHVKEEAKDLQPGERIIYGHEHRLMSEPPPTTGDSICVCAKWHGWKPIALAEAIRQMDSVQS
ncbi:MAG: metallophosphoesterase [Kiritimatiellae bacterium]|nr:metallophosphoesterase [Kiritimatiellia bacterium]